MMFIYMQFQFILEVRYLKAVRLKQFFRGFFLKYDFNICQMFSFSRHNQIKIDSQIFLCDVKGFYKWTIKAVILSK
jgi:hypothetical protein